MCACAYFFLNRSCVLEYCVNVCKKKFTGCCYIKILQRKKETKIYDDSLTEGKVLPHTKTGGKDTLLSVRTRRLYILKRGKYILPASQNCQIFIHRTTYRFQYKFHLIVWKKKYRNKTIGRLSREEK